MTTDERLSFANHLGDKSYVEGHWQIVVENACRLLEEYEGIEFGLNCVRRVLDSWTLFVPDDDRVRNALTAVENWLKGEKNVELLKHVSLAASDAAVDVDDPEEVPKNKERTRAFHAASAASSLADAARSACEPVEKRALGPEAVAMSLGYAASFSISASTNTSEDYEWQLRMLRRYLTRT
ncbi:MAG: putative immunity protein [Planctomyces sp.]|jgi:hypothetical protein